MRFGCSALVFFALVLLLYVGPLLLQRYDAAHHSTVSCTVRSATGETGSNVGRVGIGWSGSEVVIETEDCGTLLLRSGVTATNRAQVAEELRAAREVDFEVGDGTFRLRRLFNLIHRDPAVYSYRPSG